MKNETTKMQVIESALLENVGGGDNSIIICEVTCLVCSTDPCTIDTCKVIDQPNP